MKTLAPKCGGKTSFIRKCKPLIVITKCQLRLIQGSESWFDHINQIILITLLLTKEIIKIDWYRFQKFS